MTWCSHLNSARPLVNATVREKWYALFLNVLGGTLWTWWMITGSFMAPLFADFILTVPNELGTPWRPEDMWCSVHRETELFLSVLLPATPYSFAEAGSSHMRPWANAPPVWFALNHASCDFLVLIGTQCRVESKAMARRLQKSPWYSRKENSSNNNIFSEWKYFHYIWNASLPW